MSEVVTTDQFHAHLVATKEAIYGDVFTYPDTVRSAIFGALDMFVSDFLYYDRRQDEDLPLGKVEEAVGKTWITIGEMTAYLEARLRDRLPLGIDEPPVLEGVVVTPELEAAPSE